MENIKPNLGTLKDKKHYYPIRVFYNHTDAGGIVYFANYLRMTEEARVAMFYLLGQSDKEEYMKLQKTGDFVVRSCSAEYLKSAMLYDDLVVESYLSELGKSYIVLSQNIYRGEEKLVEVKFKLVFVKICEEGSVHHKPARVPEFWIERLK